MENITCFFNIKRRVISWQESMINFHITLSGERHQSSGVLLE